MYIEELRKLIGPRPLIVIGTAILVTNKRDEILLQYRSDTFNWGLPGGSMELGESLEEAAQRELEEETGLKAESLELIKVFSGSDFFSDIQMGMRYFV